MTADKLNEDALRIEFERQHKGRNLTRHHLRGTYSSAPIAALWNQHKRTAAWMAEQHYLTLAPRPTPITHDHPKGSPMSSDIDNMNRALAKAGAVISEAWQSIINSFAKVKLDGLATAPAFLNAIPADLAQILDAPTRPAPPMPAVKESPEADAFRDLIGQALHDEIHKHGPNESDWHDSREIDRLADAVVLAIRPAQGMELGKWTKTRERNELLDKSIAKSRAAEGGATCEQMGGDAATPAPWKVWGGNNVINEEEGQVCTCETSEDAELIVRLRNASAAVQMGGAQVAVIEPEKCILSGSEGFPLCDVKCSKSGRCLGRGLGGIASAAVQMGGAQVAKADARGLTEKDRLNIKVAMVHLKEAKFHTASDNLRAILERVSTTSPADAEAVAVDETALFEAWASDKFPLALQSHPLGGYARSLKKTCREGWNARAALAASQPQATPLEATSEQPGGAQVAMSDLKEAVAIAMASARKACSDSQRIRWLTVLNRLNAPTESAAAPADLSKLAEIEAALLRARNPMGERLKEINVALNATYELIAESRAAEGEATSEQTAAAQEIGLLKLTVEQLKARLAQADAYIEQMGGAQVANADAWKYRVLVNKHRTGAVREGEIQVSGVWGKSSGWMLSFDKPADPFVIEAIQLAAPTTERAAAPADLSDGEIYESVSRRADPEGHAAALAEAAAVLAAERAAGPYKLTRSIIHECPALVLPQGFIEKLGNTPQLVVLKGATDEIAEALLAKLNGGDR